MHLNFFKKYRIRFSVIQNKIVDSVFCSLNTYSVIEFNVLARCENSASRPFVSYVNSLTDQWPPSYLASFFLSCLFSSFMASNSSFTASFSLSKNAARIAIWFSLIRRASRDRLAATLFFFRLFQYFSSLLSSGTNIYIGSWKSTYKTGTCIWSLYLKDNFLQFSINTMLWVLIRIASTMFLWRQMENDLWIPTLSVSLELERKKYKNMF